jgi:endoglucanase
MKKIKLFILSLLILASANIFSQTATTVIKAMGPGFNIGNCWDNGQKTATFASVKPIIDKYIAAGMTNVRIPTTWMDAVDGNTLADGNGNLITTNSRFTELKSTIDYCLAQGLYVTLNTHHETWLKNNYNGTSYYDTKFTTLWTGIANYFKSYSSKLVFEVLNEPEGKMGTWGATPSPTDGTAIALTRQIMSVGYNAIRATGGNNTTRVVMISPNGQGNHSQMGVVFPSVSYLPGGGADKYLAMHVHSYDPWNFCGAGDPDGSNANFPGLATFVADVTSSYNTAQTNLGGIPVDYGEFGVGRKYNQAERSAQNVLDYYKTMAETMIGKNMTFSVWDDRGWFGLIDNGGTTFTYNIVPYMMTNIKNTNTTPVLTTITVTPAATTLAVGQTAQFTAAGKDQNGAAITMTPTWTVTGGGTISTSGLFTATTAGGPFTVKATSGAVSGTGAVTVTAPIVPVALPALVQAENYSAMLGIQVVATADAGGGNKVGYNDPTDYTDYSVTVATASTYTVDFRVANGLTTAGQFKLLSGTTTLTTVDVAPTGGWDVFATISKTITLAAGAQTLRLNTVTAGVDYNWMEFKLVLTPVLTAITVTPATSTLTVGQTAQFTAAGKDQNGAAMAMTPTWTVTGGGTISASGLFTATTAGGPFTVKATSGAVSGTAAVTVNAPVVATIAIPGTVQAEDYSAYNNAQPTQMRVATTDGGTKMGYNDAGDWYDYSVNVAAAGNYTVDFRVANGAVAAGQFQLLKGTAVLTTVDVAPTGGWENFVTLTKTVTLTAGVQTLRINTVTAGEDYNWFKFTQVATPVLTTIAVTPATATVTVGQTAQFAAAGKDQNGAAMTITPTWTVSGGGTISAGGLFTATTVGGPFTVTATSGTVAGTAQVTVTAAPVVTGIAIPGTVQAEDYSAYNNAQPTQMRVATTDGGIKMGYNDAGDWYDYSVNVATAGNYTVTFRVANGQTTAGQFQLLKGTAVLTTVDVAPTGGWENFVTLTKTVAFTAGVQTIRLYVVTAGVDFNWFNAVVATTPVVNSVAYTPPMVVESGFTYTVAVTYSSATANDVNVGFYTGAWGFVVGQTQTVAAGSGVLNFTITIPAATAVGNTYIWQTQIMPVGGTYLQRYANIDTPNVQVTNLKSATVGVDVNASGDLVNIYPSPVSSMLHLDGVGGFSKIAIYNSVGQLVKQVQKGTEVLFNIDVQSLKNGMYFIELGNGAEHISKKFIKN